MLAVNRLKESDAISKVIILLTDGVNNKGVVAPFLKNQSLMVVVNLKTTKPVETSTLRVPIEDPYI